MNQTVTPASLTQPSQVSDITNSSKDTILFMYSVGVLTGCFTPQVQPKPGVISSVGGMTLGKGGMQIQVLGASLTQMPAPQPPAPVQTQVRRRHCILTTFKSCV